MSVYDSQIATAKQLIAAKGESVTWREAAVTVEGQPWKTDAGAPVNHTVTIVFLPPSSNIADAVAQMMRGTSVPGGGTRGLMAAVDFTPALNGIVIRTDGTKLQVKSFDVIAPNGDPILYKINFE